MTYKLCYEYIVLWYDQLVILQKLLTHTYTYTRVQCASHTHTHTHTHAHTYMSTTRSYIISFIHIFPAFTFTYI